MAEKEKLYTEQNAKLTEVIKQIKQKIGSDDVKDLEDAANKLTDVELSDEDHNNKLQELRRTSNRNR